VGGVADVVHDLPIALTRARWAATVVTPSYGAFHRLDGAERLGSVTVPFRGRDEQVGVYDVPGNNGSVRNVVLEHEEFAPQGPGRIYCRDDDGSPFATDANKFALFGAALARWIVELEEQPDVVHLHDWHMGFYFVLREFDPRLDALRQLRTVFSIHNLAYQGVRPFAGDASSLESWYPGLRVDIATIRDRRYPDCVNPMAAAIRLADHVSTVSPTYAREICRPSDHAHGFFGGEGLESDLQAVATTGRLAGILNGCEYPRQRGRKPAWAKLLQMLQQQAEDWMENGTHRDIHALAAERIAALPKKRPRHVMVSIGRLVSQKASLFLHRMPDRRTALEHLLHDLGPQDLLILLGSGEPQLERQMFDVARHSSNLIFLRGYSETLADPLYRSGDLFLMPSSFEPCGISQMLAMRVGVPCVVHGVGGLRDTVENGVTGFVFDGHSPFDQAVNFIGTVQQALQYRASDAEGYKTMCQTAAARRFDWASSARQTIEELYDT